MKNLPAVMGCLGDVRLDFKGKRTVDLDVHFPFDAMNGLEHAFGPRFLSTRGALNGPNVVVLRAAVPARPGDEANEMAGAALTLLEELVEGRYLRIDPRLARRVEALARAIPFQPLHVALDPVPSPQEQP